MGKKTNEEKLKILQERLATIQKNQDITSETKEKEKNKEETENTKIQSDSVPRKGNGGLKYIIICLSGIFLLTVLGYGGYKLYNNSSESEENNQKLIYNKSVWEGKEGFIVVINSHKEMSNAKAEVKDLRIEGYECNLFYLPTVSNSQDTVFQTFIGPFEFDSEAKEWLNSPKINGQGEIFKLQ